MEETVCSPGAIASLAAATSPGLHQLGQLNKWSSTPSDDLANIGFARALVTALKFMPVLDKLASDHVSRLTEEPLISFASTDGKRIKELSKGASLVQDVGRNAAMAKLNWTLGEGLEELSDKTWVWVSHAASSVQVFTASVAQAINDQAGRPAPTSNAEFLDSGLRISHFVASPGGRGRWESRRVCV